MMGLKTGRVTAALGTGALVLALTAAPAAAGTAPAGPDREALRRSLDAVHTAGMYGLYSAVRDGDARWNGAAGVADVTTRRPVTPRMRHRVGSITKTFTAVAILRQVEKGRIELDAPIGRYLPDLIPGERGERITVRMLLNHTSGIADHISTAFPSFNEPSGRSLDDNRFRTFRPGELARMGLDAPPTNEPGQVGIYSNTNYVIAGILLGKVTGTDPERHITDHVIRPAGLRDTFFPATPFIPGPHSKAYEALYGLIDPPKDYSVYAMSWAGTAGALVSTMEDLNRFYRLLLTGKILRPSELAEMRTTVPLTDGQGNVLTNYGLGLYNLDLPCGRFWGHDGAVFGMGTLSLTSEDGSHQLSLGHNLMKYQRIDENGQIVPHAIDFAMGAHIVQAVCPPAAARTGNAAQPWYPSPIDRIRVKR